MTSANITDVSASAGISNPYTSNNKSKDAREDFMSMMANAGAAIPVQAPLSNVSNSETKLAVNEDAYKSSFKNITEASDKKSFSTDEIEDIKEAIEDFSDGVKEKITKELGITEEELESAMEELGLTYVDLMQQSNLAALLSELNPDADSVSLLLDDSVKNIFDGLGELTGELINETGMDTEGIAIVAQMEPVNEKVTLEVPLENEESKKLAEIEGENTETIKNEPGFVQTKENSDIKTDEGNDDAVNVLSSKVVSTTSESEKNSDTGAYKQNQGSQPQSLNLNSDTAVDAVVNAEPANIFDNVVDTAENILEVPSYTSVDGADVIDQIVTQARTTITAEVRSMELELNPHNLGRMIMQVSESEGQITARFFTQSESVKTALETAIASLIEKLSEQNIKVDAVEVSVGTHEFEESLEQNFAGDAREDLSESEKQQGDLRPRGGIHLGDPDYMEGAELSEEEELTASIMRTEGNTINFKA